MKYRVSYRFTGYWNTVVEADNEDAARNIAIERSYDVDCGDLHNIDWAENCIELV